MNTVLMTVLVAMPLAASAKPVEINLAPERLEFENLDRNRNIGLALAAGSLASGGVAAIAFANAVSAKAALKNQSMPIDLAERRTLVANGESNNALAFISLLGAVALAGGSAYFLSMSF